MSRRALHTAVRDMLRERFALSKNQCEIMFDGKPAPGAGQYFISIHRGPRTSSMVTALEVDYAFSVTLTQRVKEPYDRIGTDLMNAALLGLDDKSDEIIGFIHEDPTGQLLERANALIADTKNKFSEVPHFAGDDGGRLVTGNWFQSDPGAADVGVAMELRFAGAKRIQRIEDLAVDFADPSG